MGIISLSKRYPKERVEKASARLLAFGKGARPLQSLKSILSKNLEEEELAENSSSQELKRSFHENIRGSEYFCA